MKKVMITILMFAITTLYSANGLEQYKGFNDHNAGRFGIGLGGTSHISGLSAKLYLSDQMALQGTIGSTYGNGFAGNVDVILDIMDLLKGNKNIALPLYIGAGINFWSWSGSQYVNGHWEDTTNFYFGASGVVGLALQLKMIPLEFSTEIRPTFFSGGNGLHFYGGGAIRWFF